MEIALRNVEGSESERDVLRFKFSALRLWTGCSLFFFTLNPHDIHTPLLVYFIGEREEETHLERISLDWNDEEMADYYDRGRAGNSLRFHELAVSWPGAAAQCVRWTFQHTLTMLFNAAPHANRKPFQQHIDGIAARCEPGLVGHLMAYLGIVEPQMRLTEHIHMLLQVLGFTNPRQLFPSGNFRDLFRRVWSYFASVCFTSQESFAVHLGSPEAMTALREAPLMPVTRKQRSAMGEVRADECLQAQARARGSVLSASCAPARPLTGVRKEGGGVDAHAAP